MIDGVDQIDFPGGKSGEIKPEVVPGVGFDIAINYTNDLGRCPARAFSAAQC